MPFLLQYFSILVMLLARGLNVLVFVAFVYLLRQKVLWRLCFSVHLIFTVSVVLVVFEIREIKKNPNNQNPPGYEAACVPIQVLYSPWSNKLDFKWQVLWVTSSVIWLLVSWWTSWKWVLSFINDYTWLYRCV